MKILCLIPARSGSKGVPNKNIKKLGKKPLIAYSIEAALNAGIPMDIIVSTDSPTIKNIAEEYGASVPFIRPDYLATDETKSIDVVIHALSLLKSEGKNYDFVVLLQPTSPFRSKEFIYNAIDKFNSENFDTLISVSLVPKEYNPHWVFEPDKDGYLKLSTGDKEIISRRQDLPPAYYRDGYIYITKMPLLLEKKSFYGKKIGYVITDSKFNVNIDTQDDWILAEKLINSIS